MGGRWKLTIGVAVLATGLAAGAPLVGASGRTASQDVATLPTQVHACGIPAAGNAACGAIQLLFPAVNWHPGPNAHSGKGGGGGGGSTSTLPTSGYFPGDLQSAYGLAAAAAAMKPGAAAPMVVVVDAYNDPTAASDLAAYRASMSTAISPTGIQNAAIPPLCPSTTPAGCVTFTKVNQNGGKTSYPRNNTGWSEEISVDLDMISAICPNCNITLVEASSSSFSNLEAAVTYAKGLHPAAITNSYGGSEFSTETAYNTTYSAVISTTKTAITAATGDKGYGVEFPAASPHLTAVGGTSLTYSGSGTAVQWNQKVWSTAGSGCSAYETMPTWQKDQGVYSLTADCSHRQVGDVSAVADPSTGVAVYDTYNEPGWMVFGGTSVSAQIIGGVYALAEGAYPSGFRATPSALYPDSGTTKGPTAGLVPVTSGSNGSCGDYLCDAGTSTLSSGYNGPTGLGTPSGLSAFSTTAPPAIASLSFSTASETLTAGTWSNAFAVDLSEPAPSTGVTVTLSTTAAAGKFSTSSSGTASASSLDVHITVGSTASGGIYYKDTTAGTPTVTASATGWVGATLPVQVSSSSSSSSSTKTMVVAVTAGTAIPKGPNYHVPITVTAKSSTVGIAGASVNLQIFANTTCTGKAVTSGSGTTGTKGQATFTFSTRTAGTWCAKATVSATGYSTGTGSKTFKT